MHLKSLNPALKIRLGLVVAFTCAPLLSQAQLGVSPSQNAAFLTELRARDPKRAEENKDVLGDDREKLEAGRALSRPGFFSPSGVTALRLNADLTGFPSQYQLGRSYLTPWYDGVIAPDTSFESASGLTAGFALDQRIEYHSGVNSGKGGFILSPTLLFDGSYKLADNQRLTFSGGLGFNWVSGNDHIDWNYFSDEFGLTLLPGTSIAYDAQFGPVSVTVYERASARTYLGLLLNDLGAAVTWQILPDLSWTLNYTRTTTHDINGTYFNGAAANFDMDAFSSLLDYEINSSLSIGLEGAMSWIYHEYGRELNNGEMWNAGVYAVWKLNENSRLRIAGGYQRMKFDKTKLERFGGFYIMPDSREDFSRPYYSFSFSQRLTPWLSHELAAGYEAGLNRTTDFTHSHYANYGVTAAAWKGGQLTASAFIEVSDGPNYEVKFFDSPGTSGNLKSYGLDLHASQQITSRLDVGVGYSFAEFRGDTARSVSTFDSIQQFAFSQHMAGVNVGFAVSEKLHLNLAYQTFFFNASGPGPIDDTHRVMLGVRVQF